MPIEDLNFGIGVDPNIAGARRAGGQMGEATATEFNQRLNRRLAGADLGRALKNLRLPGNFGDSFDRATESVKRTEEATQKLDDTARKLRVNMGDAGDAAKKMGTVSATAFNRGDDAAEKFEKGMAALILRAKAVRDSLRSTGGDSNLLVNYEHQLEELLNVQRRFQEQSERLGNDPAFLDGLRKELIGIEKLMGREVQIYKSTNLELRRATDRKVQIARDSANRVEDAKDREQKQLTNITQQQTTLRNAQVRTEANRAIQASQRTARVRIELLKFTFRRLQTIERSIGAVFKGTAAVVAGAFARVERTIFRIGGVFKRGNKDFTQGLRPALNRREGIIKSSFRRQESNVRGSVARQSVTLQRFETQASTGIAGALTGRSSLGALFGGGLAIGGGFSLFRKLSQSIQVGGDFIQGLAVLQAQLQLTEQEMVGVRQLSIDLGNDITLPGVSALDAAQAIAALAKQFGALGDAALPAAEAAAKGVLSLSRATGATAEEAAAIVGSATNVFGIGADEAVATADKITSALTVSAGVGITAFKDAFTQGAAVFSSFQKPVLGAEGALVEFNTALAVLARGGLTGSQAGTGLKQFLIQSVKAGDSFVALRRQIAEAAGVSGSVFFDAEGGTRKFTDAVDILRKGLAGFTEEAKQTTLVKLFGARASTVALNLIGADPKDFDLIREAQERVNTATEVATAQNVGLRGALDALGSVIETQQIKTYEKWQGAAAKVALKLADMFQAFFEGTGIMEKVRTAIVGVTLALGGLLALKGAFELTKFLGIGLTGLISPLGVVVVGVAALGGAIALLLKSSESFGDALGNIGSSLGSAVVPILEFAGDLLAKFFNLLDEKVVPSVVAFSVALAEGLESQVGRFVRFLQTGAIPALIKFKDAFVEIAGPIVRDVFDFIKGVVNPVLERLGQLIDITVVPAFNRLAEILEDKVDPALQKIRDVGGALRDEIAPLIKPATDAFRELGEAIGAIAGGVGFSLPGGGTLDSDFGSLIPAFQNVVSGIAESFGNIAERIIEVLGPQIPVLVNWLLGQFSVDRLIGIVQAFGRLAEGIGKVLGTIVSSPEFLGALAGIAATAGFLAIQFLEGLARGFAVGLPRTFEVLKDEFGDEFEKLLKAVFNPVTIGKAVLAGFVIAGLASTLFKTMSRPMALAGEKSGAFAGQRSGRFFAKEFALSVKDKITGARTQNDFATGFFGGLGAFDRQAQLAGERGLKSMAREQTRAADTLRVLGRGDRGIAASFIDADGIKRQVRNSSAEIDKLVKKYGAAAVAGAELRARNTESFNQIKIGAQGLQRFIGGEFRAGFSQAATAAQGLGKSLAATLRTATKAAKQAAAGIGQAIGTALISGIGAALSGKQIGGAENKTDAGIGLAGLFASALFGGAAATQATGGNLGVGAVVGGTILAIGLTTAVVEKHGQAAKKAAERIGAYKQAILDAGSAAEEQTNLTQVITDIISGGGQDVRDAFRRGGFRADLFAELVLAGEDAETALAGSVDLDKAFEGLEGVDGLGVRAKFFQLGEEAVAAFLEATDISAFEADVIPEIFEPKNFKGAGSFLPPGEEERLKSGYREIGAAVEEAFPAVTVEDFRDAVNALNQERLTGLNADLSELTGNLEFVKEAADSAREELLRLIEGDYRGSIRESINQGILAIPGIGSALQGALETGGELGLRGIEDQIGKFRQTVSAAVAAAVADNPDITALELEALIKDPFAAVISELEISDDAKTKLREALNDSFSEEGIEASISLIKDFDDRAADLQEKIDALKLEISASVIFSAKQINDQLRLILGDQGFIPLSEGIIADRQAQGFGALTDIPVTQAQIDALIQAQKDAREANAPTGPVPVPGPNQEIFNYNFDIEQNITGSDPIPTAAESVHALVALASGGRLELV